MAGAGGGERRFSELLVACERDGPQVVAKHGVEAAVLVPFAERRRLAGYRGRI